MENKDTKSKEQIAITTKNLENRNKYRQKTIQ